MAASSKGLRWAVNINHWKPIAEEWEKAMACIQREERDRINQFVFAEDATLSLVGRILLRAAVVNMMGVANDVIVFNRTDKWKPYLTSPVCGRSLELNVSHQGGYSVLAAEWDKKVGVDIMESTRPRGISSLEQFFSTMNRQFTEREWLQIKAPPTEEQQLALFYRHWCLKESYIKAIGTGLSHGLQRLDFKLDPLSPWQHQETVCTSTLLFIDEILASNWIFEESFLDIKHCVAVATEGSCVLNPFKEVFITDLLSTLIPLNSLDCAREWNKQRQRPRKHPS